MEFASDYVLDYEEEVYEQVSDDEYEKGMSVSSDSDSDDEREDRAAESGTLPRLSLRARIFGKKKAKTTPPKKSHWKSGTNAPAIRKKTDREVQDGLNKRWFRRADTNIVSVKFDTLLSPGDMHAGEPVVCAQCGAILSHISILKSQGSDKVWSCEFCDTSMPVDMEEEERPTSEDTTYLLEPAVSTTTSTMSGMDQSMVIFVVDTSGSMCVTTEVAGQIKLRGTDHLDKLQSFNDLNEDQRLPSQEGRNVTYISRLQAMQAAVDHQLEQMAKEHGNRRVGLVTFNNEVTVIGDGSQAEVTIAGDKLAKEDLLMKESAELSLTQTVRQSRKVLGDKIYKLEEGGATALGPALVVAVNMAAQHPGSKVILCTDGKANVGLGKLEESQEEETAMDFYGGVGERALAAGVTVSVITISGTDCKLVHLGQLADKTGGQVNIVDPLKLTEKFSNILSDPIIATKVKATFILHKNLYILDELNPEKKECRVEQQVGNVYSSSSITFQFAKKSTGAETSNTNKEETEKAETKEAEAGSSSTVISTEGAAASSSTSPPAQPKDLPFQLQIEYTDTEGNKALRVLTRTKPLTSDRQLAEERANLDILGHHAAKATSELALQGQYSQSRGLALMQQRLAWRNCNSDVTEAQSGKKMAYKNIFGKIKSMENRMSEQQKREILTKGRTCSDSEGSDDEVSYRNEVEMPITQGTVNVAGKGRKKQKKIHKSRASEMDDSTAELFYEFRQAKGLFSSKDSSEQPSGSKGKGAGKH